MIKRAILLSALCAAGSAWAQQSLDISEKDLASGAANARLSALARTAASSGKRVVVTAPQHLHAQVAAALAAGGEADVVLRDGFYENVLVRVEDKVEEAPRPAAPPPAPAPATARPAPVVAPPAPPTTPAPAPATVSTPPPATPAAASAAAEPPAPPPPVASAPSPAPPPVTTAPATIAEPAADLSRPPPVAAQPTQATAPASEAAPAEVESAPTAAENVTTAATNVLVATEPGDVTPTRASLEKLYNDGRRIRERITPGQLKNGDMVYTGDGAAVVVRRDGTNLLRFWLEGELNLGHRGLEASGRNRYRVIGSVIR
ncbi:MAG TPA: hypothetical protein PKO41_06655 [Dokdonella sp.]|uniref:hypothetical protein n=2 Tax=Dokdonella sp. TaxID=2291710 RepID=UPI0025BD10FB|nr:hypothetical protein [Dokdonella sp.]MBX3692279.1 hypothetical protein [Dokdonella sp.]HNR92088.1 hypothetical protein [Dokdonella sp.]